MSEMASGTSLDRRSLLMPAILLAGSLPLLALASPQSSLVAERQTSMKQMAEAVKTIAGMFGGKTGFDPAALQGAATILRDYSGSMLFLAFPDDALELPESNAAAAISAERSRFEALALKLREVATAFDLKTRNAVAITNDMRMGSSMVMGGSLLGAKTSREQADLAALPAEHLFHMMLETCTSCHGAYRINRRMK